MGRHSPKKVFLENKKKLILAGIALTFLLLVLFLIYRRQVNGSPTGKDVYVEIPKGSSASQIASILGEKNVVWSSYLFYWQIRFSGVGGKFKAGNYQFTEGSPTKDVLEALSNGDFCDRKVTIPEGLTIGETADLCVEKIPSFSGDLFIQLAEDKSKFDYNFLESNRNASLEGYLFPNTYAVDSETTPEKLIGKMLDEFGRQTADLNWSKAHDLGFTHFNNIYKGKVRLKLKKRSIMRFTPANILTIASMIENEAKISSERPKIAAVIYNRLRNAWRLEIDATVQYALGGHKKRLLYSDLKTESPYNTYLHRGLPPGPICSPGIDSIKAAFNPAAVPYFYYVAKGDGGHIFCIKQKDFLNAKKRMKLLRSSGKSI